MLLSVTEGSFADSTDQEQVVKNVTSVFGFTLSDNTFEMAKFWYEPFISLCLARQGFTKRQNFIPVEIEIIFR